MAMPAAPSGAARPTTDAVASVDLLWIPLGAGRHVVHRCGRWYESAVARRDGRTPCDLYHAALEVRVDGTHHVIESAPTWDRPEPDRGVVAEGPVGLPWLGRWRWFRYEVRCWRDGTIPDAGEAVGGPRTITHDDEVARRILAAAGHFPTGTWGRDELGTGDMWNSNSLVAWLLATAGVDVTAVALPPGGRAPGWQAGVTVAGRTAAQRA